MLTRSRNMDNTENVANMKDTHRALKGAKGEAAVKTRSRSVLGELKTTNVDAFNNDSIFKKPFTAGPVKPTMQPDGEDPCELDDQQLEVYSNFLQSRFDSRTQLLKFEPNRFLDFDAFDIEDCASASAFAESIFNYLQDRELSVQPLTADFMAANDDVTARMRYILINWLVQVHQSYKMQPETLYLCVALMDKYLQKCIKDVSKDRFQLIGVTALFISSKFEEMFPPDIGDFSAVTDNAYTKKEIRQCEQMLLQSVDFHLSIPLPITFLRRLSRAVDADRQMHNIAKYLLELTIQEYDLCHLPSNIRACIAMCLSRALTLQTSDLNEAWHDAIAYLGGYKLEDVTPALRILARAAYRQNSPSKFRSIFDKYRLDDYYDRVAALPQLRSYIMENLADLKFDDDGAEAQ